jgi:hypothetical protein
MLGLNKVGLTYSPRPWFQSECKFWSLHNLGLGSGRNTYTTQHVIKDNEEGHNYDYDLEYIIFEIQTPKHVYNL